MKKLLLTLFVFIILANFAIAQEAVATAESHPGDVSFFGIVASSGVVGVLVWTIIFTMWPVALLLGIISVIFSSISDGKALPFTFKWLLLSPLFYFFVGSIGVIYGIQSAGDMLNAPSGSAKAMGLALGISNTLYPGAFTLSGMIPFLFFIFICIIILHFKKIPSEIEDGGEL